MSGERLEIVSGECIFCKVSVVSVPLTHERSTSTLVRCPSCGRWDCLILSKSREWDPF